MYPDANCLSREEALRLYTQGSSDAERERKKGAIAVGQFADLVALTDDYFAVLDEEIKSIESVSPLLVAKLFTPRMNLPRTHLPRSRCCQSGRQKVFGGYGAPLDTRKAVRAGVPMPEHRHNATCHELTLLLMLGN